MTVVAVAVAGALGASARYLVDWAIAHRTGGARPWGTLAVNVGGSLVGGVVAGTVLFGDAPATVGLVAGVGFAGSFTTFSTFAVDTVRLVADGHVPAALVNIAANLLASLAAAGVGLAAAAALL
ncbi:MAG: CrcB family protein [Egibacteraceae bacterium]